MVAAGTFREDLLYRLNGYTIHLPPLRERKEDLPLLVEHFLRMANRKLGRTIQAVTPDAMRLLEAHPWPGNVRELQSAIRFAAVQAVADVIAPDSLPRSVRGGTDPAPAPAGGTLDVGVVVRELLQRGEDDIYRKVTQAVDRVVLETVLRRVGGNQSHASELLGISRTTLRAKLHALGLVVEKQVCSEMPYE